MRKYEIGQHVMFVTNEFDIKSRTECVVIEVEDNYAIAMELTKTRPMILQIDDDTEYLFNELYEIKYDDGKIYNETPIESYKDAQKYLEDAIEYMGGNNWCGLHIVKKGVIK